MNYLFFLLAVGFVSLTGVLMPGPVFAAAIVKGAERKNAGAWIALGHILIEVPLILAIAAGFHYFFTYYWVKAVIGLAGGSILFYIGIRMFQMKSKEDVIKKAFPMHPMLAGITTTVGNPYFILWWATVGASFIILALKFGIIGIFSFLIVHESCDLGWDYLVSYSVFKSKRIWTNKVRTYIFGGCGIFLAVFGIYFILAFLF